MSISVCIATYRRPDCLRVLLDDLAAQDLPPFEVVVVDNDATESARAVVDERRRRGTAFPVLYDVQPQQNISLTRNRTVKLASGEWLAFIDDDERAPQDWLQKLHSAALRYNAHGVQGPVIPRVPNAAPPWIRRGEFYSWPRLTSGVVVPRNLLRFGNVLLYGALLRSMSQPFDPAYGLTGGEDGDLLTRLANTGERIVWSDDAAVYEPVSHGRLSLGWLLRRALRGGQDFARHRLAGRYGHISPLQRAGFALRALLQAGAAALLAAIAFPVGRHTAAFWLCKCSANIGKLTVFFGFHYREYAAPPVRNASP